MRPALAFNSYLIEIEFKRCHFESITISNFRMEKSTTLQDAYRPYSGKNYVPTAAARVPTMDGKLSMVKTTKAIHIPARPKSQIKLSADKMGVCIFKFRNLIILPNSF